MPNDLFIQDRIRRDQQRIFFYSGELFGIQSASISYQVPEQYLKFLGCGGNVTIVPNGPSQGQASFSALMINGDPFLQYTGESGINGSILRNRKTSSGNFSFMSGFLMNYRSQCSIGQIPQMDASIAIFGNVGKLLITGEDQFSGNYLRISGGANESLNPKIVGPGSIDLSLDDFVTNRVNSYDLSITTPRSATYALGNRFPTSIDIIYPIVIDFNCQFEIDDYQAHTLNNFPCSPKVRDLELTLRTFDKNERIQTFQFYDMMLVSESYNSSVDNSVIVNAGYRSYITRKLDESTLPRLADESGIFISDDLSNTFILSIL